MSDALSLDDDSAGSVGTEHTETESGPTGAQSNDKQAPQTLPLDQAFGILKNKRRRYVLKYLRTSEEPVSLGEVAEQIAAWENDKEVPQISSSERKRVYVGLYQCHLPKMDGVDVVSFDKARGTIEVGENASTVYRYIDLAEGTSDKPWHLYSVGLSVIGAVVLSAATLLSSVTTIPALEVAVGLLVVSLLGYSLVSLHWIRSDR